MYDRNIPKNISSLLLITILVGGFCSRALINLKPVLEIYRIEKTKRNINTLSILYIFSIFSFVQNFTSQSL